MGCTEHEKPGGDPDGAVHRNKAGEAGRPDLQRRVDDLYAEIGPRLDAIDAEFAAEHGFEVRPRVEGLSLESRAQGQVDEGLLSTRDPPGPLELGLGRGGSDPVQLGLFGERGPGRAADRATATVDPEGRTLRRWSRRRSQWIAWTCGTPGWPSRRCAWTSARPLPRRPKTEATITNCYRLCYQFCYQK